MNTIMVVATFKSGTDHDEVTAMDPQESAAAEASTNQRLLWCSGILRSTR
jgi:hypothetical protein